MTLEEVRIMLYADIFEFLTSEEDESEGENE